MDKGIQLSCDRWVEFNKQLKFKESTSLHEQITMFSIPMCDGLKNSFPAMQDSPNAALFLLIAKGIEKSGTHTKQEIEEAFGTPLPD